MSWERELARQRASLLAHEGRAAGEVARGYATVTRDLRHRLRLLTMRISEARARGEEIRPSWLAREERYQTLIVQLESRVTSYLRAQLTPIERAKAGAIEAAMRDAPALTASVMGRAPRSAIASVHATFTRLPSRQMEAMIRNAGNGRPLGLLLARAVPATVDGVRDALLSGIARGAGVREIAAEAARAGHLAQTRALTITRTEVLRAYRETAQRSFEQSDVVEGWTWHAALDERTCPVCTAMHGQEFSDNESLDSHVNCRCTMLPRTKSWADLGFDIPDARPQVTPGPERFAGMGEEQKLAILGRTRLEAYNAGKLSLQDLVRPTHSEFGPGRRLATLAESGL